jgi:acyl carrier protein
MKLEIDITAKTKSVISNALNQDEVNIGLDAAMGITDKWDSIGQLNLVLLLESEFDLLIPDDLVGSLTSLKAIVSWLMLQS